VIHKSYKFRLKPTQSQTILLEKHFGCSRFVFNYFLKEKQEHYLKNKKTYNYNNCSASLTKLKQTPEHEWLNDVNAQSLQQSLKHLETSYGNFFNKRSGFPKFKSKRNKNSFKIPQFISIKNNKIKIPKFKEGISFTKHREIKGNICFATISKNSSGRYHVSITCELEPDILPKTNKSVGIDLGLKDFIVTSDNQRFPNQKILKKYEKQLKINQKHLARKQKGSNRKEKQRKKVARIYEKIANFRNNLQHQISYRLITEYDNICLESLSVKNMMKNHKLSKVIGDISWSAFIDKLKYKADWYGKNVVQIEHFYPSSKTCNCCGYIKTKLELSERQWTCSNCDTVLDRDLNAAKNILQRGMTILSSGTDDHRHGVEVRLLKGKTSKSIDREVSKKTTTLGSQKPTALWCG
jgi:putative transposase